MPANRRLSEHPWVYFVGSAICFGISGLALWLDSRGIVVDLSQYPTPFFGFLIVGIIGVVLGVRAWFTKGRSRE